MKSYFAVDPAQLLQLAGSDVSDLLHRISASEVRELAPGESRRLLFCDEKGRIVDLPLALREATGWWLLANEGSAGALADWIERFVITEDVQLRRAPAARFALCVEGQRETLQPAHASTEFETASLLAEHWIREGLLRPRAASARKLHPLECGLRSTISFSKGCYIGQEVVARMDSYDKVQRALHWLRGAGAPPAADASLRQAGRECGRVLESCPDGDDYLALVQLSLDAHADQQIEVEGAESGRATRVPDPAQ